VLKPLGNNRVAIGLDITPGAEGTFDFSETYRYATFDDYCDKAWFQSYNPETRYLTLWATQGTPSTTVSVSPWEWETGSPVLLFGEVDDKAIFRANGYHSFDGSALVSLPSPYDVLSDGGILALPEELYRNGEFFAIKWTNNWDERCASATLWKTEDCIEYQMVKVLAELPYETDYPDVTQVYFSEAYEDGFYFGITYYDWKPTGYAPPYYRRDQVWKTDGTVANTVTVLDQTLDMTIREPWYWFPSDDSGLADVNGTVYLRGSNAGDGFTGRELYTTTGIVKDIAEGVGSSSPMFLTNANGALYFTADDGIHGRELWRSDGTEANTVMVSDGGEVTSVIGALNDRVLYVVQDSQLWSTDGTTTVKLHSSASLDGIVAARLRSSLPLAGDKFFFAATDSTHGTELWMTDGTPGGTELLADMGPASSLPTNLTMTDEMLYFIANDGVHGREIWRLADVSLKGLSHKANPAEDISQLALTYNTLGTKPFTVTFFTSDDGSYDEGTDQEILQFEVSSEEIKSNPLLIGLAPKYAGDTFESPDDVFMPGEHTLWIDPTGTLLEERLLDPNTEHILAVLEAESGTSVVPFRGFYQKEPEQPAVIRTGPGTKDFATVTAAGSDDVTLKFRAEGVVSEQSVTAYSPTKVLILTSDQNDDIRAVGTVPIIAKAGSGADVLIGGGGSDKLFGGTGDDTLEGGGGDDTLLTESNKLIEDPDATAKSSPAYTWYFLAMAHQANEQPEEAKKWLDKATEWTDKVVRQDEEGTASLSWNRRLTLRLLREEAEAMIEEDEKREEHKTVEPEP
jgi:ELWxxDGT repeat protein